MKRRSTLLATACALCLGTGLAAGPAYAADFKRQVTLEGLTSQDLRQELRDLLSVDDSDRNFTSIAAIRRIARDDATRMLEALNAKGYYAAEITPRVVRDGESAQITFQIERGPQFDIIDYRIRYADEIDSERPQNFAAADITPENSPRGEQLLQLQTQLLTWLQRNGFPAATANRHYVEANFETGQAIAIYEITSGPKAYFGEAVIQETGRTRESFIASYAKWDEGALYDRNKVIDYREDLGETGLFSEISAEPGQVGPDGRTDILVTVAERDRRTLGAGVSYATDVGPGISLFWQDRNLLRRGETLTARADLSGPEQLLGLTFGKPLPGLPGSFNSGITAQNEITDAFEAQTLELSSSLSKRWFSGNLTASGGLGLVYTQVEDARARIAPGVEPTETFTYAKFPLNVTWDNSNDILNPTKGFRTSLTFTPYAGDTNFMRVLLSGATRHAFGEENRLVAAVRASLGGSFGADTIDIPATERFYAGGGGSIRGYAYQEAGPLDADGNPIGGSSLVELNTELRYAVRDNLQIATFIDGGTVSDNEYPDFSEDVLWAAGIGARYMTPIGPLRVDLATPLNPREIDDAVQFYIALGQPF